MTWNFEGNWKTRCGLTAQASRFDDDSQVWVGSVVSDGRYYPNTWNSEGDSCDLPWGLPADLKDDLDLVERTDNKVVG